MMIKCGWFQLNAARIELRVTPHRCWKILFLISMAHDDDNKLEAHNAGLLCVCVAWWVGGFS